MILSGEVLRTGGPGRGWIEVDGPRIAATGDGPPPRPADVEHAGLIAPGLVDLQVNGAVGREVVAGPDALAAIDAHQLRHGVTSYLPTIITTEDETAARAVAELAERAADESSPVAGVHLEGPFLNPAHRGVHRAELLRAPADGVPSYYEHPAVRLVTLAPELPGSLELAERLAARGVAVALGHTGADEALAERAAARGATLVTHLFNAMAPLRHREPGLVGWALATEALVPCVIPDGRHVAPTVLELIRRTAGDRVVLVTDASVAAGAAPGAYLQAGVEIVRTPDGRVVTEDGTLAGSALALDEAVRSWADLTGARLGDALDAATRRPAAAIGLGDGLRAGAPADLVLLDAAGGVRRVMHRGRWVAEAA